MTSKPQIDVALKLTGAKFVPDEVTRLVGLTPTRTWRSGDQIQGTELKRKQDGWVFGLRYRETYDMDSLLNELLDSIWPHLEQIKEVAKSLHLKTEISFGTYVREETPTCWFAAATIQRVSELGADLDVDLILTK